MLSAVALENRVLLKINFFAANEVFETIQILILNKQSRTELTVVLAEYSIIATSAWRPSSRGHERCTIDCHGGVESCRKHGGRPRGVSWWQRNWMTLGICSGQARTRCLVTTTLKQLGMSVKRWSLQKTCMFDGVG